MGLATHITFSSLRFMYNNGAKFLIIIEIFMSTVNPTVDTTTGSSAKKIILFLLGLSLKFTLGILIILIAAAGGLATGGYMRIQSLPDVSQLQFYDPNERSEIFTADGKSLKQIFGEENRKIVTLKDLPPHVPNAVLAIEDARFEEHTGVDPIGIARAVKANMDNKDTVQGGSTITQQVVKNLFLTTERTYARKAAEAVLSVQVDQKYSKEQILELYLNLIYLGHNAYGVETAAETYFGKPAKELELHEAAMIAGLIRGPELFSPYRNYAQCKKRQALVLNKMVEHGYLDRAAAEEAKKAPLKIYGIRRGMKYPYFTSYVMHYLKERYSETDLETQGYKIYTSLNIEAQDKAKEVLWKQLDDLEKRNVEQGAVVTINAKTGHVLAMVGGRGFDESEFNRAFQAQRQTGSSFKPFVYVTAFENGYTPYTTEVDGPVVYRTGPGSTWKPKNYGGSFSGPMSVRRALMASTNIVAVKVMDKVGIDKVIDMTKRLGIKSEVRPFLSSALGASEITPLEMAHAFSSFANDGVRIEASPILRIEDKHGNVILDNTDPQGKRVLDQDVVRALNHSLLAVVNGGTAMGARVPGHQVAGKTGTTESHKDVWFVGFTPNYVTTVWVGNDKPSPMWGATGGRFCTPIWREYMKASLLKDDSKKEPFPPELPLRRKRNYSKGTHVSASTVDDDEKKKTRRVVPVANQNNAPAAAVRVRTSQPRAVAPRVNRRPAGRMSTQRRSTSRAGRSSGRSGGRASGARGAN